MGGIVVEEAGIGGGGGRCFFRLCAARCLLAACTVAAQLLLLFLEAGGGGAVVSVQCAALATAQLALGLAGILSVRKKPTKFRLKIYMLFAPLPVVGLFYPVSYWAEIYLDRWIQQQNDKAVSTNSQVDNQLLSVFLWQYLQCLLDSFLAVSALASCWSHLSAPRQSTNLAKSPRLRNPGQRRRYEMFLRLGVLHVVFFVAAVFLQFTARASSPAHLYGTLLCNGAFFGFAGAAALVSFGKKELSTAYTCLASSVSSALSCLPFFAIFLVTVFYSDSDNLKSKEDTSSDLIYPILLLLVGSCEAVASIATVANASKLIRQEKKKATGGKMAEEQRLEPL